MNGHNVSASMIASVKKVITQPPSEKVIAERAMMAARTQAKGNTWLPKPVKLQRI
jgi:hypothetical protein